MNARRSTLTDRARGIVAFIRVPLGSRSPSLGVEPLGVAPIQQVALRAHDPDDEPGVLALWSLELYLDRGAGPDVEVEGLALHGVARAKT